MTTALTIAAFVVFGVVSLWLVVVDLREHRLPNVIVGWGSLAVAGLLAGAAFFAGNEQGWAILRRCLIAACCYGAVFLLLWLLAPSSLGAGDVKLAPLIGLMAGWAGTLAAVLLVPLAIAGLAGIAGALSVVRKRKRLAFGPVLILACWLGMGLSLWS